MLIKQQLQSGLRIAVGRLAGTDKIPDFVVEYSPRADLGDYSTNAAFVLSKVLRRPPEKIAGSITAAFTELPASHLFLKIEINKKGYINFFLKPEILRDTLAEVIKKKEKFALGRISERVLIEYSSPNIGKPLGVGHLRSTIIGDALFRIFAHCGFKIKSITHPGDWGKQIGFLIAGLKASKKTGRFSVQDLACMYVEAVAKAKEDKPFNERALEETKKLQSGDLKNLKIWKKISNVSRKEFEQIYKELRIRKFDLWMGESAYQKELHRVVAEALQRGIARRSEGAVIIPFGSKGVHPEHVEGPLLIQKSDGAFLYGTTDLAALKHRVKKFKPSRILYVVGSEQSLHLQQVFTASEKLGYTKRGKPELTHVKFGLLLGEDLKKFSTRVGKTISIRALVDEAIKRSRKIVEEKNPDLSQREKEKISRAVGIGAIKYFDLSRNRMGDVIFSWEHVLSLQENSAPYIQYTHARLQSILRKAPTHTFFIKGSRSPDRGVGTENERAVARLLIRFPEVIEQITVDYFPNHLTDYLFELASEANAFYESSPVLESEQEVRASRLRLVAATATILKLGLNLLGIETPERM